MAERIKVLNINRMSDEYAGVAIFLMNVYKYMDHERYQLDFLTPDTTPYNPWREEIERAEENIYEFHIDCSASKGIREFGRCLREFLLEHPYDVVHINCGAVFFNYVTATAAKTAGAKVVVHSHSSGERSWWKNLPIFFLKCRMQKNADVLCACSMEAARHVFTSGKVNHGGVIIITNGIDLQKFGYDAGVRRRVRQELHIADRLVVGHVGRFDASKNQKFLLDIFAEILKDKSDSILFLIGTGESEDYLHEKAYDLKIDNKVMFLGQRSDVSDLYQAMDIFLFPSLFEGLGLVLVEAQASGLPCYISDVVPREVDLTDLIHRISLQKPAQEWANEILAGDIKSGMRSSRVQELTDAGYGIQTTVSEIVQIYDRLAQIEGK